MSSYEYFGGPIQVNIQAYNLDTESKMQIGYFIYGITVLLFFFRTPFELYHW